MNIKYAFILLLTAAMAFFVTQPLAAQSTEDDLEQFRSNLDAYYADLAEAYADVVDAGGSPDLLDSIAEVRRTLPDLSDEDLALLRQAFVANPGLWYLPEVLRSNFGPMVQGVPRAAGIEQGGVAGHAACVGPDPIDLQIAKIVALAAELLKELVPDDIVTAAIRPVFTLIWAIAENVVILIETLSDDKDDCEHGDHQGLLEDTVAPRIDVTLSTRAAQESLDQHASDVQGALDDFAEAIAAHNIKVQNRLDIVQTTLDTKVELRQVHLNVIELRERRSYLVSASEGGQPVDVAFISVQVMGGNPPSFVDLTTSVTLLKPGVHLVEIDLPNRLGPANIFEFQVRHGHANAEHFGIVLFDRRNNTNQP